jgi:hypothetical protein
MYLRRAARDPISVAYEKYTQETGDEEISVTEDGVALTSPLTTSYYRWPAIQRVARSRNVIALVVPNGFVPIPKRALCAEQTAELDLLLANHVERKERAFPVMEPGA